MAISLSNEDYAVLEAVMERTGLESEGFLFGTDGSGEDKLFDISIGEIYPVDYGIKLLFGRVMSPSIKLRKNEIETLARLFAEFDLFRKIFESDKSPEEMFSYSFIFKQGEVNS